MKCESKIKHSRYYKKMKVLPLFLCIILMILGIIPGKSQAQMFSVGGDRYNFDVPASELYLGVEPTEVIFEGESEDQRAGVFAFEGTLLRLGYKSRMLNLSLGTGGEITGLDDVGYFDFGGNANIAIPVYQSSLLSLHLPLRISSRFTNMTNSMSFDRFRFGNLTLGAGAKVIARYMPTFRFEAGVVPSYGFSFASGGIFGGSMGSVAANSKLYLDRLFNDVGLSIGYRYHIRNYDIDEEIYDYRINTHSLQVGITF